MDEVAYTFLSRVAVVAGDLETAFSYLHVMKEAGLDLRMRTCMPCLQVRDEGQ